LVIVAIMLWLYLDAHDEGWDDENGI